MFENGVKISSRLFKERAEATYIVAKNDNKRIVALDSESGTLAVVYVKATPSIKVGDGYIITNSKAQTAAEMGYELACSGRKVTFPKQFVKDVINAVG
jgi:hypothetical protein